MAWFNATDDSNIGCYDESGTDTAPFDDVTGDPIENCAHHVGVGGDTPTWGCLRCDAGYSSSNAGTEGTDCSSDSDPIDNCLNMGWDNTTKICHDCNDGYVLDQHSGACYLDEDSSNCHTSKPVHDTNICVRCKIGFYIEDSNATSCINTNPATYSYGCT
jgi:hypothetical protein